MVLITYRYPHHPCPPAPRYPPQSTQHLEIFPLERLRFRHPHEEGRGERDFYPRQFYYPLPFLLLYPYSHFSQIINGIRIWAHTCPLFFFFVSF